MSPTLAACLLPKCPLCASIFLAAVGIHWAIPSSTYVAIRAALLAIPLAWIISTAYHRCKCEGCKCRRATSLRRRIDRSCVTLTVLIFLAPTLSGEPAGTIWGTVRDPSGGLVTQAVVRLTCDASGLRRSAVTGVEGVFEFVDIAPGTCALSIEAAGFKRANIGEVTVEVDHVTRIDSRLELGLQTETIEVVAAEAQPQIDRPTAVTVIHSGVIADMPLNGRQYLDLAALAAGTIPAAPGTQGSGFSVNGIRSQSNVYLLDGISNIDTQTNQPLNLFRIADAVEEFAVQTTLPVPEFGRGAGAQVNVVTRSGTNEFHGAVFEYFRNTVLNAADFFTNKAGAAKNALHRNEFGARAGGPIERDRTFFFVSYEGFRQIAPTVSSTLVPTAQQRAGVTDPISQRLLAFYPVPNTSGAFNYIANVRAVDSDNTGLARVDHRFGYRDSLAARWTEYWGTSIAPGPTPLTGGNQGPVSQVSASLSEQHTFSANFVNELRLGESRFSQTRQVQDEGFDAGSILTDASGSPLPGVPRNAGLPSIVIGGGFAALGSNANFPQSRTTNTTELFDSVSRVAPFGGRRHTWRWGGHVRREDLAQSLNRSERGSINFSSFADFAHGQINTATLRTGSTQAYWRRYPWDLYWQNEFRARPNLTLTFGLRYEYPSVLAELHQHATGFLPGYGPAIAGTDLVMDVDPSARGAAALVFRSVSPGLPAGGAYPDRDNLAPMVGFGWSPFSDQSTIIRGGARIAYDDLFNNVPAGMVLAAPYNLQTTQTANVTQPGKFAWPVAFNQDVPLVSNAGQQGPGTPSVGVLGFQAIDPHLRSARAYIYSASIERRVGAVFVEASYRGSEGRHLGMFVDINQPTVIVRDPAKRGPVAPNEQIFSYNHFNQIQLAKSIGNSDYNGLVLTARRPLRRGLLFQASYVLGKSLDYNSSYFGSGNLPGETGAPIDNHNIRLDHGPSAFDVRHQFVAWFTADVPDPFRSRALRNAFGGWRVSGIATLQTGTPFTVVTGNPDGSGFNQATAGTSPDGGNRPMLVKQGPLPQDNSNTDDAFDTSWFAPNLAGQDGTSPRNAYRGPGMQNINLSVAKFFSVSRVREDARLAFRADFFNLLNHTNFANPVADMSNAAFGRITQTLGSAVATSAGVSSGPPGGPRIVQLSLRVEF